MAFWDKPLIKTKWEIIEESGYTHLSLISTGSFLSKERGRRGLFHKQWKTFSAIYKEDPVTIMVVDKIVDISELDNFLKKYQLAINEKDWMLLLKREINNQL